MDSASGAGHPVDGRWVTWGEHDELRREADRLRGAVEEWEAKASRYHDQLWEVMPERDRLRGEVSRLTAEVASLRAQRGDATADEGEVEGMALLKAEPSLRLCDIPEGFEVVIRRREG